MLIESLDFSANKQIQTSNTVILNITELDLTKQLGLSAQHGKSSEKLTAWLLLFFATSYTWHHGDCFFAHEHGNESNWGVSIISDP
jgi:hypothetical protein